VKIHTTHEPPKKQKRERERERERENPAAYFYNNPSSITSSHVGYDSRSRKTIYKPPPLPIVSEAAQNLDAKKRSSHTNTQHCIPFL
jgi:hypothetical protein